MGDKPVSDLTSMSALAQEAAKLFGVRPDQIVLPEWQGWWSQIVFVGDNAVLKVHKEPEGDPDPLPYESFLLEQKVLKALKGKSLGVSVPDLLFTGEQYYGMTRLSGIPLKSAGGLEGDKFLHQAGILSQGDWFIDRIATFIVEFDSVIAQSGVVPKHRSPKLASDPLTCFPAFAEDIRPLVEAAVKTEQNASLVRSRFTHADLSIMNILIEEAPLPEQRGIGIVDFGLVYYTNPNHQFGALLPFLGFEKCMTLIERVNTLSRERGDCFNLDPVQILAHQTAGLAHMVSEPENMNDGRLLAIETFIGKLQSWIPQLGLAWGEDALKKVRFRTSQNPDSPIAQPVW